MSRVLEKGWFILTGLLIIAVIAGGIILGIRQWGNDNSIDITPPPGTLSTLQVHLTGSIANEGIYIFDDESSLGDILRSAGGYTEDADTTCVEFHIPSDKGDTPAEPQRININTAESWLLEALPEIGPTLAQRIIDYRETEGLFNSIDELTEVNGIGTVIMEKIRDKIKVTG